MAIIKNPLTISGSGDTSVTNGTLEQYTAYGNAVPANTFVEFVGNWDSIPSGQAWEDFNETLIATSTGDRDIPAISLGNNRVAVFYPDSTGEISGVVCDATSTPITQGSPSVLTNISGTSSSQSRIQAFRLRDGRILLLHGDGSSTPLLHISICSVSGDTISTDAYLAASDLKSLGATAVVLDETRILIAARASSSGSLTDSHYYAMVATVSNNGITLGTATEISDTTIAATTSSTVIGRGYQASGSEVVLTFPAGNNLTLLGTLVTVQGTTVSAPNTPITISSLNKSGEGHWLLPASDGSLRIFYVNNGGSGTRSYDSISCRVENGNIVFASSPTDLGVNIERIAQIAEDAAVAVRPSTLHTLDFSNEEFTIVGQAQRLSNSPGYARGAVVLENGNVFATGGGGSQSSYARIIAISPSKSVKASSTKIDGVTKTECTSSTAGDVWVLNS